MISFRHKGDFSKTKNYFNKVREAAQVRILDRYGQQGVDALSAATPVRTGLAASSWYYEVEHGSDYHKIVFSNSDIENGFPVAIMLQYGHGTGTGGWVEGIDYINPALKPIFNNIAEAAWEEVTRL